MFYPYIACIQINTSQENNLFTAAVKQVTCRNEVRACEHTALQHREEILPHLILTRSSIDYTFIVKSLTPVSQNSGQKAESDFFFL